ncbi:sigma-54-dependent transcriptional regulator [Mariniblastus fucicola]|uniref:Transcriptional regulatory protein ZraR n=1 Tax=Mariniblastus fucicola TaxID=980251 RepID=A0A5B9PQD7_9BACT|nr:sigma-54 dependent transcriptional regulator [Mariniblastus fucicola]QEG24691.1 Transcriptional regulatory protein ZraR [Mariniblastus fucicola]
MIDGTPKLKVLLIDDQPDSLNAMSSRLESEGYAPIATSDAQSAWQHLDDGVAVVVTELDVAKTKGVEVVRFAKQHAPHAIVIVVSAEPDIGLAVAAVREGAFDYLTKPVDPSDLVHRIEMALSRRRMAAEIASLHLQLNEKHGLQNMVGNSPAMRSLYEKIRLVADTRSTVLVTGESGTGKELVARSIHHLSKRKNESCIPINCAAIPETLVESELFGHEKGAFTGATDRKQGFFEAATKGTLFIDEIGELELGLQAKLLRAIENRTIMRVGSTKETSVDVRLVAATNRDLAEHVKNGHFREDLFYRLKVVELKLPPLRQRKEDIALLVQHFIAEISADAERPVRDIDTEALEMMKNYSWPGNVRELRNTLEGMIVLSMKPVIEASDLPTHISNHNESQAIIKPGMTMSEIEKEAIRRTLQHTGGNRTKSAEILGISLRTLQRKVKEFGL